MGESNRVEVIGENGRALMHGVTVTRAHRMVSAGLARWTDDGRLECRVSSDASAARNEGVALLESRLAHGEEPGCRLSDIVAFVAQRSPYRFRRP
jgi:hypothetical protein